MKHRQFHRTTLSKEERGNLMSWILAGYGMKEKIAATAEKPEAGLLKRLGDPTLTISNVVKVIRQEAAEEALSEKEEIDE